MVSGTGTHRSRFSLLEPHQSVEHQRVVRLLVRCLHHDAKEGVQGVLQELPPTTGGENKAKTPKGFFFHVVAHLDDLAALHRHQPLQDLLQVVRVGPPVQQTQEIHWEKEQDQSNI